MQVVVSPETEVAVTAAVAEGRSTWRVSSTVFAHIASDQTLQSLGQFATPLTVQQYPAMPAGEQVRLPTNCTTCTELI